MPILEYLRRRHLSRVSKRVRDQHLTYLSKRKLLNLERCLREINRQRIHGMCVEAGVANGGSAIVIASLMGAGRVFKGYDVFGMIPAPSEQDDEKSLARYEVIASGKSKGIGGEVYYGYQNDLLDAVVSRFCEFGMDVDSETISLHPGLFEDTLTFNDDESIALAHIDCDWHDPVALCFQRIGPRMSPGGFLVIDDYNDYGGCRTATDAFLAENTDFTVITKDTNAVLQRRIS